MKPLHIVERVHVLPGQGLTVTQPALKTEGLCGEKVGKHNRVLRNNYSAGKVSLADMERICEECRRIHEKERGK